MVTIYGIRNCDTMKKARAWLDAREIAYAFHDYKVSGNSTDRRSNAGRSQWAGKRWSTGAARHSGNCPRPTGRI